MPLSDLPMADVARRRNRSLSLEHKSHAADLVDIS